MNEQIKNYLELLDKGTEHAWFMIDGIQSQKNVILQSLRDADNESIKKGLGSLIEVLIKEQELFSRIKRGITYYKKIYEKLIAENIDASITNIFVQICDAIEKTSSYLDTYELLVKNSISEASPRESSRWFFRRKINWKEQYARNNSLFEEQINLLHLIIESSAWLKNKTWHLYFNNPKLVSRGGYSLVSSKNEDDFDFSDPFDSYYGTF